METSNEGKPVVLITGAAGTVGGVLARALSDAYCVVGMDQAGKTADMPMIAVDLTADVSVDHALSQLRDAHGAELASVIHLAAFFDFTGEDNPLYQTLNVDGTRRLLERLQRFRVEQFVYSSSMLVERAGAPGEAIDEDRPLEPKWAYPQSKATAEQVIRDRHGAIPYAILRLAGLYDDGHVVATLAHQIARIRERDWESHAYAGSLATQQSMIHHDDLAAAVRKLVDRRAALPRETVMLLGEPDPPSYQELQDAIGEALHGEHWPTLRVPAGIAAAGAWVQDKLLPHLPTALGGTAHPFIRPFMMKAASDNYALDIGRAHALLDWEPRRLLQATLPTILAQLKENPRAWYKANKLEWRD